MCGPLLQCLLSFKYFNQKDTLYFAFYQSWGFNSTITLSVHYCTSVEMFLLLPLLQICFKTAFDLTHHCFDFNIDRCGYESVCGSLYDKYSHISTVDFPLLQVSFWHLMFLFESQQRNDVKISSQ